MLMRYARRLVVLVIGGTVLLIGIAMIVLPGPAIIVIPIGLAILATEYAWARRLLHVVRDTAGKGADKLSEHPVTGTWTRRLLRFAERICHKFNINPCHLRKSEPKEPQTSSDNP